MEKLIGYGNEVYGLLRRKSDSKISTKLANLGKLFTPCFADIRDFTSVYTIIDKIQPDWIFHLASQSFVPESFRDPTNTFAVNSGGTFNVLESVRLASPHSRVIFAGSSEEYGLQFKNMKQYLKMKDKYGQIEPHPKDILAGTFHDFSELPINEQNPLRPMSPYAVSKVHGDYMCRNYHMSYGLDTVVSRAFNHEGAGRGDNFITSKIVREAIECHLYDRTEIHLGNTSITRDWSHVDDIVNGYVLLAEKAEPGSVYVQGSGVETTIAEFVNYVAEELHYMPHIVAQDESLFRPSDVPHLQADISKIKRLGYKPEKTVRDIVRDLVIHYWKPENRKHILNTTTTI